MSEVSVIFLEEISSSQADTNSIVRAAVSPSPFDVPEEKVAGERGEESPVGGPDGPNEVGGVCETEAGTEADVEDEDEDVDVVGGVDEVGVSGYECEGFHTIRNPSSKETCEEECVRGCRWHRSPSTMWVFKTSTFTIKLYIRISLLASHWILLG